MRSNCSVLTTINSDCLFHIHLCARFTQICIKLYYYYETPAILMDDGDSDILKAFYLNPQVIYDSAI